VGTDEANGAQPAKINAIPYTANGVDSTHTDFSRLNAIHHRIDVAPYIDAMVYSMLAVCPCSPFSSEIWYELAARICPKARMRV
jgi:hypothetical protein